MSAFAVYTLEIQIKLNMSLIGPSAAQLCADAVFKENHRFDP